MIVLIYSSILLSMITTFYLFYKIIIGNKIKELEEDIVILARQYMNKPKDSFIKIPSDISKLELYSKAPKWAKLSPDFTIEKFTPGYEKLLFTKEEAILYIKMQNHLDNEEKLERLNKL